MVVLCDDGQWLPSAGWDPPCHKLRTSCSALQQPAKHQHSVTSHISEKLSRVLLPLLDRSLLSQVLLIVLPSLHISITHRLLCVLLNSTVGVEVDQTSRVAWSIPLPAILDRLLRLQPLRPARASITSCIFMNGRCCIHTAVTS